MNEGVVEKHQNALKIVCKDRYKTFHLSYRKEFARENFQKMLIVNEKIYSEEKGGWIHIDKELYRKRNNLTFFVEKTKLRLFGIIRLFQLQP